MLLVSPNHQYSHMLFMHAIHVIMQIMWFIYLFIFRSEQKIVLFPCDSHLPSPFRNEYWLTQYCHISENLFFQMCCCIIYFTFCTSGPPRCIEAGELVQIVSGIKHKTPWIMSSGHVQESQSLLYITDF